jgi:uncharacterized protein (DUF58 family)
MAAAAVKPRYRTRLVKAGFVYALIVLVLGIAAGVRPNNLLVLVFGCLLGAIVVSGVVSGFMMMPISATRLAPRRGRVGEPLLVRYEVSNRSRFLPAFDLRVREAPLPGALGEVGSAWVMHAGPGDRVHAEAVLRPLRRGPVRLASLELSTAFPFGLLRKIVRFTQPGEVLIHPEVRPLRAELLSRVTAGGIGGNRLSSEAGGSDDFFGVREYRPGDSIRRIAWKRLAGTGRLATIERSRSVPPRVRVLLDLRTPTASLRIGADEDGRTLEEAAIVLAASLVSLADRLGYEYALSVGGLEIPAIALRKGHFHREKILSLLAALDLDAARGPGNGLAASDERATVIVVHPDRADTAVAPAESWHFTARQLESLVDRRAARADDDANPRETRAEDAMSASAAPRGEAAREPRQRSRRERLR